MSTSTPARYRKPTPSTSPPAPTDPASKHETNLQAAVQHQAVKTSSALSVLDVVRILAGIALLSAGTSYLSTSGESMTWGYNARWTRAREWRNLFTREIHLSDSQLLQYDGSSPEKPIYLALNGTIYDVSASPQTYGPGGSYHVFAGRDAARAFITGCFAEDAVPDLRGAEWTYMPVDAEEKADADAEVVHRAKARRELSRAEKKNRRARELRVARKKMRDALENWHVLFRGDRGKPYRRVGTVMRDQGWLDKVPVRKLCEQAEKSRPVRKYDE